MFTLAQYVFGIGKTETSSPLNDDNNCSSTDTSTAYHENSDDPNQCVQTNIENDWILIEIEEKNSNAPKGDTKALQGQASRKPRVKPSRSKPAAEKVQSSQEESWFVEPPECFKNCSPDSRDVKTSSLENLLIEHPSMSVFDNLFTKRFVPTKLEPPKKSPSQLMKQVVSKKAAAAAAENTKENNSKFTPAVHRSSNNKKKQVDVAPVNVLTVSNQNKALTAIIQRSETFQKKKCITKKNYERQNKVSMQLNGPIIRRKKMFTHLNGVYHTRNHC